ncbi:hypothetical protein OJ998_27775 [Solirubrobacter taibaiensis]|nr:hypothetical protein [Solirubrobacter taibaiensis]
MLPRFIGPAIVIAGALLLVPGQARANHHACPQVTVTPNANGTSTINVARKNCAPTYVPYPIGGPKSPLISGVNQTVPLYLPGIQTPLVPDLGQWGDIITPPYSDPLNDAGPDLSCLKPNLGTPQGGDPPIPSPGSAADPFPIEYVLKNGNLQLGDGREVAIASVCAPTVIKSDGSKVYLFADANIKTAGSSWEVLVQLDLLLRGLL